MPSLLQVRLSQLILAARNKLVADAVFSREQAKISLRMNPPAMGLQADNYAIVFPLSQFFDQGAAKGGMRYTTLMKGRLNVYPRVRDATDVAYEAEQWLTKRGTGILDTVHGIIDSLHGNFLEDDDGDQLTTEPLRGVFWGEPKQRYGVPDWGDVVVEFEMCYWLQTGDTYQLYGVGVAGQEPAE